MTAFGVSSWISAPVAVSVMMALPATTLAPTSCASDAAVIAARESTGARKRRPQCSAPRLAI